MPTQPRPWNILGDLVTCTLSGRDTGGSLALFDVTVPADHGPPPHVHHREDETFHILTGEFEFQTQGKTIRRGPGESLFAPRDIPHSFRNISPSPARMIILVTPAGAEKFFEEVDREIGASPPDMAKLLPILARYGMELVGPPK